MKLLVIRFSAMGDVALVLPALRAFLDQNQNATIYFVSKKQFSPIFDTIPRLYFIGYDPKKYKGLYGLWQFSKYLFSLDAFDATLDLHDSLRSTFIRYFFWFQKIPFFVINKGRNDKKNIISKTNKLQINLKHHTQRYADVFDAFTKSKLVISSNIPLIITKNIPLFKAKYTIGIAPLAAHQLKEWPLENYKSLIINILQNYNDIEIYLFGGTNDLIKLEKLLIHKKVKLAIGLPEGLKSELEYMANMQLMICNDSGNMHLAAMLGTIVLPIFGPTTAQLGFEPYLQKSNILEDTSLKCRPCTVYGNTTCYLHTHACMHNITPAMVLEKVQFYLPN